MYSSSSSQKISENKRDAQALQKLYIKSWGCQMNVYDSERMAELLAPHGYRICDEAQDADLIILNTCHIRDKATEKLFSELGRLHKQHQNRKAAHQDSSQGSANARGTHDVNFVVAGCVAQAEGQEITRRAPYVDLVIGPQNYHELPNLLAEIRRQGKSRIATDFPVESKFDHLPAERQVKGVTAFLSIQEGCDKFCSFCVVPYTRGAEFSRPAGDILAEARTLLDQGVKEITLLGQNVNAWHGTGTDGKTWSLARLLYALAELTGVERLRYTTSHPRDMDDALITAHGKIPQLMPFLHLPVQSGSNHILQAMNRKHDRDQYLRIVDKLRQARPDLALSSDFIVGFPGESDQDFAQTLALVREVGFAQAYSFCYSPRPGTPASMLDAQLPEAVKKARLAALQQLLGAQQLAFNQKMVGQLVPVLFDRIGTKTNQMLGRTPYLQVAAVDLPPKQEGTNIPKIGDIWPMRVRYASPHALMVATIDQDEKEGARLQKEVVA